MKNAGLVLPGCKGGFVLSQALVPGLEAASAKAEFAPKVRICSAEHKLQPRDVLRCRVGRSEPCGVLCVQQRGGRWSAPGPRACEVSGPRGSGPCVGIRMI